MQLFKITNVPIVWFNPRVSKEKQLWPFCTPWMHSYFCCIPLSEAAPTQSPCRSRFDLIYSSINWLPSPPPELFHSVTLPCPLSSFSSIFWLSSSSPLPQPCFFSLYPVNYISFSSTFLLVRSRFPPCLITSSTSLLLLSLSPALSLPPSLLVFSLAKKPLHLNTVW